MKALMTFNEFCATDALSKHYYGTHRRGLYRALLAMQIDKRPVLELGMGDTSTQLLHDYCESTGKVLYSVDDDDNWRIKFASMAADFHVISKDTPADFPIESLQWSVALVDHKPADDRYRELERLRGRCGIIVLHDIGSCIWPLASLKTMFKYAVEDPARPGEPPTGVVSDDSDVSGWTFP